MDGPDSPRTHVERDARIAVIGAGIAGLAAARALSDRGLQVEVFDKARGPAGRTSTRRAGAHSFDHGAQYFTAREPDFRAAVAEWREAGVVDTWSGRIAVVGGGSIEHKQDGPERLVGVPGMNALAKHLARDLALQARTRVVGLGRSGDRGWLLRTEDEGEHGPFDRVVVTLPAAQAAELLGSLSPIAERAREVEMRPCTAAMVAFSRPVEVEFDGAFVDPEPFSWIARDSSKPGRPPGERWVLHTSADWSAARWETPVATQVEELLAALSALVGCTLPPTEHTDLHRWRYSIAPTPLSEGYLADERSGLVLCGDWCLGGRVEGAWMSGLAAAGHLLGDA